MGIRPLSRREAKKMPSLKMINFPTNVEDKAHFLMAEREFFAPSELISLGRKQTISQKSGFMHPSFRRRICFRLFIFLVKTSRSKATGTAEAKKAL